MFSKISRILRATGRELAVLWFACRNPATPLLVKLAAVLMGLYVFSPIDILPDALPVLGWIDDVTVLAFGVPALLALLPQPVLQEARIASARWLSRLAFWRVRG
jgi:uncharacterized membrane protein YkvA (DUF1232 family)